jgi:hypothetical protein
MRTFLLKWSIPPVADRFTGRWTENYDKIKLAANVGIYARSFDFSSRFKGSGHGQRLLAHGINGARTFGAACTSKNLPIHSEGPSPLNVANREVLIWLPLCAWLERSINPPGPAS